MIDDLTMVVYFSRYRLYMDPKRLGDRVNRFVYYHCYTQIINIIFMMFLGEWLKMFRI